MDDNIDGVHVQCWRSVEVAMATKFGGLGRWRREGWGGVVGYGDGVGGGGGGDCGEGCDVGCYRWELFG
ncbi:hypothetical protein LIER_13454 [Lithospermum erythrorhizon]|uniref:Uncharacterized protein n=1 Tax=Lithospermum erythrorhizon TaxID=34254 RepID=A0AAV3PYP6_LITER